MAKALPQCWHRQYYQVLANNCFNNIMQTISEEELEEAIQRSGKGKAPGPLKIHTEFWTKGSQIGKKLLQELMNTCLKIGDIPADWKKGSIILIPKPKEWNRDITNTRPIALIEPTRKIFTRIFTNRISKAYQESNILQGNDFFVLNNIFTSTPIYIINAIIEYVKAYNKEA